MPKKSDKRRQQRRRQHQSAQAVQHQEDRRQLERLVALTGAAFEQLEEAASQTGVPPEAFAASAARSLDAQPALRALLCSPDMVDGFAETVREAAGVQRCLKLARAVGELIGSEPALAWLGVALAEQAEDNGLAEGVAEAALARLGPNPDSWDSVIPKATELSAELAFIRAEDGRLGDALALLTEWCALAPGDDELQQYRARLLARTAALDSDDPILAKIYPEEVAAEQAAVARALLAAFPDRSLVYRLREEVESFIAAQPDLAEEREEFVTEFLETLVDFADLGPFDEPPAEYVGLAAERFWLMESEDEAPQSSPLARLAEDPATHPAVAAAARDWSAHVRYGLWLGDWPPPDESHDRGLWVTDLVTRRRVYAVFAPEQIEGLARWTALAGALAPVAGVWQSGQSLLALDPYLADQSVENLLAMAEVVIGAIAREHGLRPPRPSRLPQKARPHGVLSELLDPVDSAQADLMTKVTGSSLPHLAGAVEADRRRAPQMRNMDGDPIELITASFPVQDASGLRRRLLANADFRPDGTESSDREWAFSWLGRIMTADEVKTSREQARALARQKGWGPLDENDDPQRWVNGMIRFEEASVEVQTNSRKRFEALSARLQAMGAGPPSDLRRIDPAQDLNLKGRPMGGASSGPEADAAWAEGWIDTKVPALEGDTPRKAAQHPRRVLLLETLLRHFEHGADLASAAGNAAMDFAPLRARLGLSDGPPLVDDPAGLFR